MKAETESNRHGNGPDPFWVWYTVTSYILSFIHYFWLSWVLIAVRRLSLVAVHGLLTVVASLAIEHGL